MSDGVLVFSPSIMRSARSALATDRVAAVTLPATLIATGAPLRHSSRASRPFTLVAAGRAVPQKGFDILLSTIRHFCNQLPSLRLSLHLGHGSADYQLECARLARLLGPAIVSWRGWTRETCLLREISTADLLVVPSRFEPFGLVVANALACRTPVLGSAVGGIPELLDHGRCGFLIDVGSDGPRSDLLAKGIRQALESGEAPVRAARGRAHLKTRFSGSAFVADLSKVVESWVS
jgi:glycosyltransferase involved in cell wall biosynthesis